MAEPWIEEAARLAEELGWRMMNRRDMAHIGDWVLAFSHKASTEWSIRCISETEYWVVRGNHHWGNPPAKQDADGPFGSFLEAATTYHLIHSFKE